jgi:hypothetical protein
VKARSQEQQLGTRETDTLSPYFLLLTPNSRALCTSAVRMHLPRAADAVQFAQMLDLHDGVGHTV